MRCIAKDEGTPALFSPPKKKGLNHKMARKITKNSIPLSTLIRVDINGKCGEPWKLHK